MSAALCATGGAAPPATAPATQPSGASPASTQTSAPSTPTTAIKRGSLSIVVDAQGAFEPVDPFEARLKLKAYQGELLIKSIAANGAAIKKGDVLLEIDSATMQRTLAAAENEDLAAKANLAKAEADIKVAQEADVLAERQQQDARKQAEDQVKWFETVDGPQTLKQVELGLQQSKDQMDDQQDELDQLKKLYKADDLTNATADIVVKRAVRNLDLYKTLYAMAGERANKVRTFSYPITKQRVYDNLTTAREQYAMFETAQQQAKVLRQTTLEAVRAAAVAAGMKLDDLKADANLLTFRAPFDGSLCYGQVVNGNWSGGDPRTMRAGEHVAGQAVLMTLYQPGRLKIALDLPEAKFFAIQPGQKASISPVAEPELKYEGMCEPGPKTPAAGGAGYAMTLSTGNVDPKLVPGMKAQIHMDVPLVDNVLLAPTTAIVKSTAWVKTANAIESRHVMTGRSDGKSIEILSGLHEGDQVLTQGKQ